MSILFTPDKNKHLSQSFQIIFVQIIDFLNEDKFSIYNIYFIFRRISFVFL